MMNNSVSYAMLMKIFNRDGNAGEVRQGASCSNPAVTSDWSFTHDASSPSLLHPKSISRTTHMDVCSELGALFQ
jgi:hypothetical protein